MTARFRTCAIITTISALVSAGFSVAGLFGPSGSDIFERYATSRSIALLIAVLCCIGVRSRMGIAALPAEVSADHLTPGAGIARQRSDACAARYNFVTMR
jgi:hypothetical protein